MISTENSISQQKDKDVKVVSRTFEACDVKKSDILLGGLRYRDAIQYRILSPRRSRRSQKDNTRKKLEAIAPKRDAYLSVTHFHSFVETLHYAFKAHYPVTISPDMIWLLITQGFAKHVNDNGEKMRHYFVDFQGKKNLDVRRNNFVKGSPNNDWQGVFEEFSVQIEQNTGPDLLELVTGNFSTTTAIEKAAFQVTLMDSMKSYFTYSATTMCGIPEVTLEGTVEDWQLIETKAQTLAQYDLQGWIGRLMPILREFTAAARGEINKDFWKSIYKWNSGMLSGGPYITGWILKFFPSGGSTTSDLPSGLSKVDFIWNYYETFYEMEFTAGFVGFHQDPKTLSLRPEISWAVIDKNEKPSKECIESYRKDGDKDYLEI